MEMLNSQMVLPTDWDKLRPMIDEMMHQLDDCDRNALLLRFFEGKPFTQVAYGLGLSEVAARGCVDRAITHLRAILAKRGISVTGVDFGVFLMTQTVVTIPLGLGAAVTAAAVASDQLASDSSTGPLLPRDDDAVPPRS
jgi:hypothetical protein